MRMDEDIASVDWPSLLSRVFHDLVRIVQTEIKISQAGLEPILSNTMGRCLAGLAALMAFATTCFCLLAALVLYWSRWLGWPGALVAAAGISFVAGLASLYVAKRRGRRDSIASPDVRLCADRSE